MILCMHPAAFIRHSQLNSLSTKPQTQIRRSDESPKMATAGRIAKFAPKPKLHRLAGCDVMRLNSGRGI